MERSEPFTFSYATVPMEIICAPDAISSIGGVVDRLGTKRAMVLCGPNIFRDADVVQRVESALGKRFGLVFSEVGPHVPVDSLSAAAAIARDLQPDVLVSVGGGSTHDTSKALALLLAEGGDIHDYEIQYESPGRVRGREATQPRVPIISVPTTIACAEISVGGGGTVTDKSLGRKFGFPGSGQPCKVNIIDGKALATTPVRILLSTAMSAFRIAVECLCTATHNPIGDALALHGIKMLMHYIPRCVERDVDVLLAAKMAAVLPSLARFAVGGGALSTAICHQIGGLYDVAHGDAHAIMLPHTMRFNLGVTAERQALIAEAMGIDISDLSPEEAGLAAADGMAEFCRTLGLPTTLREVGVPREGLEMIASATLLVEQRALATNPEPILDAGPIMHVLQEAW